MLAINALGAFYKPVFTPPPVTVNFEQESFAAPNLTGHSYPQRWLHSHTISELDSSRAEAADFAEQVREAARHAWNGYKETAWGHDQIHPESGAPDTWFDCGLVIVEALDTLWLLGLHEEYAEAERWVEEHLRFDSPNGKMQSFFEATIRLLGGLLGAHSLTQKQLYLHRAKELGDRLLAAWTESADLPNSDINIGLNRSQHIRVQNGVKVFSIAEVATCQLEFRYLSYHTRDPTYAYFADRAMDAILDATPDKGLVSIYFNGERNPREAGSTITMGARGDSYYEYLLKQYLQTSKTEPKFLQRWRLAMQEMMDRLVQRSSDGLVYVAKEYDGKVVHEFDHLACFVAGMLVQGFYELPAGTLPKSAVAVAADITATCNAMYDTKSGLAPEILDFSQGKKRIKAGDAFSLLRPEAAEAMYYMWYYTGDHKYREWANRILQGLNRSARTTYGFTSMDAVDRSKPSSRDMSESFFFAETLKYLYLIQADPSVLPLDEFVFNTEGHPLRVWPGSAAFDDDGGVDL